MGTISFRPWAAATFIALLLQLSVFSAGNLSSFNSLQALSSLSSLPQTKLLCVCVCVCVCVLLGGPRAMAILANGRLLRRRCSCHAFSRSLMKVSSGFVDSMEELLVWLLLTIVVLSSA